MWFTFCLMSLSPTAPAQGYWLMLNRNDTLQRQAVLDHFGKERSAVYDNALEGSPERTLLININGGWCWQSARMQIHEKVQRHTIDFPVVPKNKVDRDEWFTNENPKPNDSTGEMGQ